MSQSAITDSYLLLGEGDFSFTVDVVEFLSQKQAKASVVATGFDAYAELSDKYKDSDFLLKRIMQSKDHNVSVFVHHGVNAIVASENLEPDVPKCRRVIFNHPHLGFEDAQLHGCFLCHLFHAVDKRWMTNDGFFYLTLVEGQFERWKCDQAAERCSFRVVKRLPFQVPSVERSYYQHRRHQTGRSFARRSDGSELIVLSRANNTALLGYELPWYNLANTKEFVVAEETFQCSDCGKTFRQERSLKNHVRNKHQKRKRAAHPCTKCRYERVFASKEALIAHERAKHTGNHTFVPAERGHLSRSIVAEAQEGTTITCDICDMPLKLKEARDLHLALFVPQARPETGKPNVGAATCSFCQRSFADNRARLQHENFCERKTTTSACT